VAAIDITNINNKIGSMCHLYNEMSMASCYAPIKCL
jgi:hypothetical protein